MDMTAFILSLGGLFALGMVHALGPDHLAAITTLAGPHPTRRRIVSVSGRFALGHTGVLLAASLLATLAGFLPSEGFIRIAETVGGLLLVALGALMLHSVWAHGHLLHEPAHQHGEQDSNAVHHPWLWGGLLATSGTRSLILAIPAAAAAHSWWAPVLFAGAFGLGIISAMVVYGLLLGWGKERFITGARAEFVTGVAVSAITMIVGFYWALAEWI